MTAPEDEWLWGWDPTPGIVSVWADERGRAAVWRRDPTSGTLTREYHRFRPWVLTNDEVAAGWEPSAASGVRLQTLPGAGELRHLISGPDLRRLREAVLRRASTRIGTTFRSFRSLGDSRCLALAPEEQFLVRSGKTYFRDLPFEALHRLQFDLETTGLDAAQNRMFLVAVRDPDGTTHTLESRGDSDNDEAELLRALLAHIARVDPDVMENHNLHGFDLPFLVQRAHALGVALSLGRQEMLVRSRAARRGVVVAGDPRRRRYVAPGRELIDTMDAVARYDFSTRELPGHGLKAVARHFGLACPERVLIRGADIATVWRTDPDRVRRYAVADVEEVAGLARLLGGAAFALARMAPRRYERLADAGAATGVIDPMLVRAYLRAGRALPAHAGGDGTEHTGAALHLFAAGVAHRVVKADVASLYPSLMRTHRIGPVRDELGALLALVDRLTEQRLAAKAGARAHPPGSPQRHTLEATSAAVKIIINSAYGYLAAGGLTRFADVQAANEVTRRGRDTLHLLCRELAARGVTLLEADTDGVYFAVPATWTEDGERRTVAQVGALLPPLVQLEFEGRYSAMLSHEPKNYALLRDDGRLVMRGVAFRSSRAEPFGEEFLRRAVGCVLRDDVPGVRAAYGMTLDRLRQRDLPTLDMAARVRLTKTRQQYLTVRGTRRELSYEAMLHHGRDWRPGERVRVYRNLRGEGRLAPSSDEIDPRDYDVDHYARILRQNFASRLARAFTPQDFEVVFADTTQLALFGRSLDGIRPILTILSSTAQVTAHGNAGS